MFFVTFSGEWLCFVYAVYGMLNQALRGYSAAP